MTKLSKAAHRISFSALVTYAVLAIPAAAALTPMETLGKHIFFDATLSKPQGQSCAFCHDPAAGYTSPDSEINDRGAVVHGARRAVAGSRKPPTSAYITFAAPFEITSGRNGPTPAGGLFWDGRATGDAVGVDIFPTHWSAQQLAEMSALLGPAPDQAMGPFLNDVEHNLPDAATLCRRMKKGAYSGLWQQVWGEPLNCDAAHAELQHQRAGFAIAVWEGSAEVNSFSSKFDLALAEAIATTGSASRPLPGFSEAENRGHELFFDPKIGCARFCHASSTASDGFDQRELFTAPLAGYFNLGFPRNPQNRFYKMINKRDDGGEIINPLGRDFIDFGIGAMDFDGVDGADLPAAIGKFKTPTLRNVDRRPSSDFVKAYTHNGYFNDLKQLVHFYNTRDMKRSCTRGDGTERLFIQVEKALQRDCWPEPEVLSDNIFACDAGGGCKVVLAAGETYATYCNNPNNPRGIGNLCLSSAEEDALVAFLRTLSDQNPVSAPY